MSDPFPAQVTIIQLQTGTAPSGAEVIEAVQGGVSVQLSLTQIFSTLIGTTTLAANITGGTGIAIAGTTSIVVALESALGPSVLGVAADAVDLVLPIRGSSSQVLRISDDGATMAFGAVNLASSAAVVGVLPLTHGGIGFTSTIATGGVLGFSNNTTAAVFTGAAAQVMRINDDASGVAFGAVNLASSAALTGTLPVNRGGLGFSAATLTGTVGFPSSGVATTFAVGQVPGIGTAVDAADGNIGQYLSSSLPIGSVKGLTSNVATSVISLALSPGDWDVHCTVGFTGTTTATAWYMAGSLSDTSTVLNTTLGESISVPCFGLAVFTSTSVVNTPTFGFPVVRRSLAATTTEWLTAQMAFTSGTAGVYGAITARRVR